MSTLWFLDRSSGFVVLVLFTLSLALGVLATRRRNPTSPARLVSQDLHVRVTSAALALLLVHVVTAVMDSYVDITPIDALVPFLGGYRPFWLGLGTLAVDVILLVLLTTFIRARVKERMWRMFHVLAYSGWVMSLLHAFGSGTDARTTWGLSIIIGSAVVGLGASLWRVYIVLSGANTIGSPPVAGHDAHKGEVSLS
jgi:predicted ferric reductase